MADHETPTGPVDDEAERWVTGTTTVAERAPGIDSAPDTTYVAEPETTSWWRPALIGTGVGLVATMIFAAIVVSTDSDGSNGDAAVGTAASVTSSSTRPSTTTTTAAPAPPAAAPAPAPATPNPTSAPAFAFPAPAAPPTPRATSDPAAPPYAQVPLPPGVSATLTNCGWQPTNGGQYEAGGTVTNGPSTNHGWTLTIHWLQNDREIATQTALVPLTAGQSAPWSMTLSAPNAPADPFSCALTAA